MLDGAGVLWKCGTLVKVDEFLRPMVTRIIK